MSEDSVADYDQLDAALSLADIQLSPSEVHGIIVGALCNHLRTGKRPDLMELILDRPVEDSAPVKRVSEVGHALYRATMESLLEGEGGFELELPHETESMETRTESLGSWCRGFLLGLLYDGSVEIDSFSGDAEEIIQDIVTISGATTDGEDPDRDDWAFAEIEEYLRVGIQLVFESIYEQRAASAPQAEQ